LNRYQLLSVLSYSAMFAVLNPLGGVWTEVSMLGWAPFLPIAYVTGSVAASVREGEWGFRVGAAAGIGVQVWALLCLWSAASLACVRMKSDSVFKRRYWR
jgi:hypothetical protein